MRSNQLLAEKPKAACFLPNVHDTFAFLNEVRFPKQSGWDIYDPYIEFTRQRHWCISSRSYFLGLKHAIGV